MVKEQDGVLVALEGVREDYREEVQALIENYKPAASSEARVEIKIILKDKTPIYRTPRRMAPKEQREVDQKVKEWLEEGIISPSQSGFASNVVVARKKDGSAKICIDYKPLNKAIVRGRTPMPIIEDVLGDLQSVACFSTIDL